MTDNKEPILIEKEEVKFDSQMFEKEPQMVFKFEPIKKKCNCKNSNCLKLYCECFRSQQLCVDCGCEKCMNASDNGLRKNVIASLRFGKRRRLGRQPTGPFRDPRNGVKTDKQDSEVEFPEFAKKRSCNCKHSGCKKNYCECFQNKIECNDDCHCINCRNSKTEGIEELIKKLPHITGTKKEEEVVRKLLVDKLTLFREQLFGEEENQAKSAVPNNSQESN